MIVDIGSNTVKYDAFLVEGDSFENIGHHSWYLGFISYIDSFGVPSREGVSKLCGIIGECKDHAREMGCREVLVFATASLRRCRDPYEVIERIYNETGLETVLFDGETEAQMSLMGVLAVHSDAVNGIMADMGGGSTELNIYQNRESVYKVSLPFGALSLKNSFVKSIRGELAGFASAEEIEEVYNYAKETVKKAEVPDPLTDTMYLVGGSAKAIGAVMNYHKGYQSVFTVAELEEIVDQYSDINGDKAERLRLLAPQREKLVILAASAFMAICHTLGIEKIEIAAGGIREGYMYSKYVRKD